MTKLKVIRPFPIQDLLKFNRLVVPMSADTPIINSSSVGDNSGITLQLNENDITITINRGIFRTDNNCQIQVSNISTNATRVVASSTARKSTSSEENANLALSKTFASEGLWYHLDVNLEEAKLLLKNAKEGTFLLRNSTHPSFIFTLSIATEKSGVTSIRIGYKDGLFFLDCDERVLPKMPQFSNIVELIYFYSGRPLSGRGECSSSDDHQGTKRIVHRRPKCVWIDAKKRKYLPVQLTSPKLQSLPSLKHSCRLRINSSIESKCEELENSGQPVLVEQIRNQLQIPKYLLDFLQSYPYSI